MPIAPPPEMRRQKNQSGQSIVESCIVVGLVCLILMSLFQLSQLYMAQEILDYAAGRGARAKAVGFNEFMVFKTVRVGAIGVAGRMLEPEYEGGPVAQRAIESARIPLYLGGEWSAQLPSILNYSNWHSVAYAPLGVSSEAVLHFQVYQDFPLQFPFHQAFYAGDSIPMSGHADMDNHATLYLDTSGGGL